MVPTSVACCRIESQWPANATVHHMYGLVSACTVGVVGVRLICRLFARLFSVYGVPDLELEPKNELGNMA